MGAIQVENTHVKRSSSMSFALRWKHQNLRMISLITTISFALTFMILVLLYGTATRSVSLVVNGHKSEVKTKQWVVQHLLDEQAISIGKHDQISVPINSRLKDGDKIVIEHAIPVRVSADGQTKSLFTTARTVASVVKELHLKLGKEDKVSPSLDSELFNHVTVNIVRVKKVIEEKQERIPFQVVKQANAQLLKGKQQTVREGKEGIKVKQIEKVFEDGVLASQSVVGESVRTQSVNKVIALGTKDPVIVLAAKPKPVETVSLRGLMLKPKQILHNVTLTAYASGTRTASGTRVTEGRTIAVDPRIIPMGWWVYIEGVGFRRAEDKGGAVKGNKIDVYFESVSYANKFGVKRGCKVYVIGPKKPTAS